MYMYGLSDYKYNVQFNACSQGYSTRTHSRVGYLHIICESDLQDWQVT